VGVLVIGRWLRKMTGGADPKPFVVLTLIAALTEVDLRMFGVLGPEIKDYFGLDLSSVGGLVSVAGALSLVLALPVGFLIDRTRRTTLAAFGAFASGGFLVATGLAPSVFLLGGARVGDSFGVSLRTTHFALFSDYYPADTRAGLFAASDVVQRIARALVPVGLGFVAAVLFWQAAFFALAPFAVALGLYALFRLPEPARGAQERRTLGASEEVALREERPPSFGEGLRTAWSVRTARRIAYSLPFLSGSIIGIIGLMGFLYDEKFHLGPAARGILGGIIEPAGMLGVLIGGTMTNRLLRYRPGRALTYAGLVGALSGVMYVVVALSPWLWLTVTFVWLAEFTAAILVPGLLAVLSLVSPPRARGIGLSLAQVFLFPGFIIQFFIFAIANSIGISAGLLMLLPVFVIGSLIVASAGSSVDADIRAATAAAMAAEISLEAKREGQAKLIVARDVDVHYGDVQILFNVDFEVEDGEIIALLGTNGAGKSTLLRAIGGLTEPSNGAIFFDGEDITHLPASEHAARGIIMSPGGRGTFPSLTVAENLRLAAWMHRADDEYVAAAMEQVFEYFPILKTRLAEPSGNLSGGEQQMLTLGQAFLSKPRLLMIDELSLGLAPAIVEQLLEIVQAIAAGGATINLVEQSVNIALTDARRAVFMEKGEVKFSGSTAELMQRPDILRSVYLKGASQAGRAFVSRAPKTGNGSEAETVLELRDVRKTYGGINAINDVSFTVRDGETLGLIGPTGAGKTTLFDIISGFVEPDGGTITLFGEDVTDLGPDERAKLGLQRSFQDASLFAALTVRENVAVALERHLEVKNITMTALGLPQVRRAEAKVRRKVDRLIELLGIGDFEDRFVRELSTGTRRIVDLEVRPGEILGIIGSNGAGKTTLFDICSGFLDNQDGDVMLDGVQVTSLPAHVRSANGLGRVFQDARLFPSMTVTETLAVALERHADVRDPMACILGLGAAMKSERKISERVEELLDLLNLRAYANSFISELSTGTRRVVELGCAVAHRPSVLLLDEPSSGLAQRETEALASVLLDLRETTGAALVVIEHDIPLLTKISDRMVCLHLGRVIASGSPKSVLSNKDVIASYLGSDDTTIKRSGNGADTRRRPKATTAARN
jgi:branched-chain amino acid transport system ATP-binding protein